MWDRRAELQREGQRPLQEKHKDVGLVTRQGLAEAGQGTVMSRQGTRDQRQGAWTLAGQRSDSLMQETMARAAATRAMPGINQALQGQGGQEREPCYCQQCCVSYNISF